MITTVQIDRTHFVLRDEIRGTWKFVFNSPREAKLYLRAAQCAPDSEYVRNHRVPELLRRALLNSVDLNSLD